MSQYKRLYCVRRVEAWLLGVSRYNAATRPGPRCDMTEEHETWSARHNVRYDQVCAATRPGVRFDTPTIRSGDNTARGRQRHDAWCAMTRPAQRAVGEQPESGCVPGAPNSVLTQCTIFSHCLRHCSRGFQKKKSNQIKSNEIKYFKIKFSIIKFCCI